MSDNNPNTPKKFDSLNFNYDFSEKDYTQDKKFMEFQQKNNQKSDNDKKNNVENLKNELFNTSKIDNTKKNIEQFQEVIQSSYEQKQRDPVFIKPKTKFDFNSMQFYIKQFEEIKKTKSETLKAFNNFKERILPFADVLTLAEAKALSNKILPVKSDITVFNVGGAKCTVVNKPNLFRITLENDEELLCYDFL